jgi:hypothetical protein
MTPVVRNLLVLGALAALALPASASASANQVISDCAKDGKLDRNYSNKDLRQARDTLPADLDEYSDCRDVIAAAIKGGSDQGGGRGSPGIGATDPAGEATARNDDAADLSALTQGGDEQQPSLDVGGRTIEPGSNGLFNLASAANQLPLPLLLALILFCLLVLGSGIVVLRDRWPMLARHPLVSKIPAPRVPFPGDR